MSKKIYFLSLLTACSLVCAFDDCIAAQTRVDCTELQAQINTLTAIQEPTEEQTTQLAEKQALFRSECSRSAEGRRSLAADNRASLPVTTAAATPVIEAVIEKIVLTGQTALDSYLEKRQSLCDELQGDIDTLTENSASEEEIEPLQNQYKADCTEIDKSKAVEIDALTAAENRKKGLCPDGSAPNRFGCCDDDVFTDKGNLVFKCCPKKTGECYDPITDGNAI